MKTGVYEEITYRINGGEPHNVSNNEPIFLDEISENTTIELTVRYSPPIAFSDYTEPYYIPDGEKTLYEKVSLCGDNSWSYTWENLPREDANGNPYYYTVEETEVTGYHVIYSPNNTNGIQTGQLVITNQASGYVLPKTGGSGTFPYTAGGSALLALPVLMYIILRRKEDEAL